MLLQISNEERRNDHKQHERQKQETGKDRQRKGIADLREDVVMDAATQGEKSEKKQAHRIFLWPSVPADESIPSGNHYSRAEQGSNYFIQAKNLSYCHAPVQIVATTLIIPPAGKIPNERRGREVPFQARVDRGGALNYLAYDRQEAKYFEALALQSSGLAWSFYNLAFANQQRISKDKDRALQQIVAELGADLKMLSKDLNNEELAIRISQDANEAREMGFQGAPVFLINGIPLFGAQPLQEFERVIRLIEGRDRGQKD